MQIHNLPSQPTRFIGRKTEINEIVERLRDENCQLLTLLGAGGMGKTRLSIEAVKQLTPDDFEQGVYYVPLAPLTSADNIVTTVISVLGIMIGNEGTPQEELVRFLQGRNLLLIMDNFEHVLDSANLVADILMQTDHISILTTSREPLNLLEEHLWHVRGMHLPHDAMVDDFDSFSGLRLFVDRAHRVRRDFDINNNRAESLKICQLVGGMPLGIELAASWLKTLSCSAIIKQIQTGMDFLSTRARNIPDRHRSIRVVFDHSWNLLSNQEQAVFPRLSVFRGGFTLDAAEAVADADLIILSSLVEKSMVRRDDTGRYDLHELLRQYADEKLKEAGEIEATSETYMRYVADFMAEHTIDIKGCQQLEGLNAIQADWINIQSVWNDAVEKVNYGILDAMMEGIALYCDMHSRYQDGETLFQFAVYKVQTVDHNDFHQVWNKLRLRFAQTLVLRENKPEAVRELAEPALSVALEYEDAITIALGYWILGESYRLLQTDLQKAIEMYQYALPMFSELGDLYYKGRVLRGMAFTYLQQGELYNDLCVDTNQKLIKLTRDIGDMTSMAHAILYDVMINRRTGRSIDAEKRLDEMVSIWERYGDRKSVQTYRTGSLFLNLWKGEFDLARQQAMQLSSSLDFSSHIIDQNANTILAFIASVSADNNKAQIEAEKALIINPLSKNHTAWRALCIALIGAGNWQEASENAFSGLETQLENYNPLDAIQWLPILAVLVANDGNHDLSVELSGLAFNHPDAILGWTEHWSQYNQLNEWLQSELSEETYQSVWIRGAQRDLEVTIQEMLAYFGDNNSDASNVIHQPLLEPLTERELEVLELIAEGLTNPQIAEKLYLATGTVKVHTRNIYGKLAVSNRTEAATKARDLNLI